MKQQYKMRTSRCVKGRMIRSRQLDPRFSAFDSRNIVQQFNGYWLGVELHSTAFSSLPGPVSSHTRQPFLLYQVRCRVTLDSPSVPGPLSSSNRQVILVYHVLCSSKLLRSNGRFWNPNINRFSEKIWTRLSELTVTSWTAKWSSCWLSQNLDAERGNEECGILSPRNQFKYPRTQCR